MENIKEKLNKYFEETSPEQVLKDWEETKEFDNVGISVDEFEQQIKYQSLCLAQKMLREEHNINISMYFKPNIKKWDFIVYSMELNGKEYIKFYKEYYKMHQERRYDTYEEALEAAIEEAIDSIKLI